MWYKLSDLFDLQMGKTPSRNNPNYWNSKDYLWVSISDMSGYDKYVSSTKEYISERAVKESGIKTIPANTVIMSFKLSIGKTAITTESIFSNEAIMAFIDKKTTAIDPEYIFYLFSGKDWDEGSNKAVMGKTLNKATLSNTEVDIPSLDIQKERVDKLNKISTLIADKKQQLNQLDELVKARFVEMFGNYKMEKTVGEVATICRGASPRPISKFITESNGENWIKIGDVKEDDTYITKTKELVTEDGANRSRRIKPGDFILSNSMSFGRPYISKIYGCVHDGWLIISDYEQSFLPLFFYYAIRSELVQAQFRKSVAGAVVKNLNSDLVRSVKIVIPSIESQEKFASFVAQVDKSKFAVQKSLEKTQLLFDSLMQEYFG